MRYIDINLLQRPEGWDERSQRASEEVRAAKNGYERKQIIDRHDGVWREMRDKLRELSHDKCWYCETKSARADTDVDHFRPKLSVAECPDHEGYWWLAFDWRNYRYSCRYCNSPRTDPATQNVKGKHDHFPLLDEITRAYTPDDPLDREDTCLLDPTNPMDSFLLWFDETGDAKPDPEMVRSDRDRIRAEVSITTYHLNYSQTRQVRMVIANYIKVMLRRVDRYFEEDNREALDQIFRRLREYTSANAEYSVAARCSLQGFRSQNRPWLNRLLETD